MHAVRLHADDQLQLPAIESPFFLVGSERSGTTLLRLMLDHHPQLAFHHESEFMVSRLATTDDNWPELDDYSDWLRQDRIFLDSRFEIDQGLSYPELMRSFLKQKLMRDGKRLVGATVHYAFDQLPRIWPQAKYIHLIRDPRDVARSVIQMGWAGNFWHAADTWLTAEQTWDQLREKLKPNAYIEVHYEDLISDYERVLTRICKFIGIPFSQQMLEYANCTTYELPDSSLAQQWKRKLSRRQIGLVEGKCETLMQDRGYTPEIAPSVKVSPVAAGILKLHSRVYRSRCRLRRYGTSLVVKDFLARRIGLRRLREATSREIRTIDEQYLR